MIKIKRAHHTSYTVNDLEKAKDFYGRVLGLPPLSRPNFGFPGAWFSVGPYQIHLIAREGASGAQGAAVPQSRAAHLALEVEDVEPVKQRLEGEGISYAQGEIVLMNMRQVFCRDPDGNQIEFIAFQERE